MAADFRAQIDWRRPWLAPLWPAAAPIMAAADWRAALNAAAAERGLRNHRGRTVHFVPQSELPDGVAYEAFISATGGVPTRDNLHDFFNALVWLTYPRTKVALNAVQAAEIERAVTRDARLTVRGKVRDAATIYDENAALLVTRDAGIADALRQHRWDELFIARRDAFLRDAEVRLFGHALMEKLVAPYKAITAHVLVVAAPEGYFMLPEHARRALVDRLAADRLAGGLTTGDFMHLPMSGVPGWWDGQDAAFYADAAVFRPKRKCPD